jgi:hypothetical protein
MYKQIAKMGDAAGVSLTKVLAEKHLDDIDIKMSLVILRSSFADPSLVETEADRQPRAALFVLRCLERDAADASTKKDVTETREYLQRQFSTYKIRAITR